MARVGIYLYPCKVGVSLEDVDTFGCYLGGSATNVAVAAGRHGRRSAVITRTGRDPFGRFVHRALRDLQLDDRFVGDVADLPTPITFCEMFPPENFPIWFYRWPKAPDLEIRADELDLRQSDPRASSAPRHRAVRRAEQDRTPCRMGCPRPAPAHDPRPRLPSPVLGLPSGSATSGTSGPCAGPRCRRKPRRMRDRHRRA